MKSVEFVKKYGIEEVAKFIHFDSEIEIVYTPSFFEELKQFVWAFELVEENGGLKEALEFLRYAPVMHPEVWKLQDAITLVEQCL